MQQTFYKQINVRPLFFGIEFMHVVIISLIFIFSYLLTHSFLFVIVTSFLLYLVSRLMMSRKPTNWLEDAISYHIGAKVYLPLNESQEGSHVSAKE